jgi:phosphoenolpyruvate synthase/pyruvate phosphate dikinase
MPDLSNSRSNGAWRAVMINPEYVPQRWAGVPASAGTVEGPCTVIRSLQDHPTLSEGTILVCEAASRELALYAPSLRGLVTERGGLLSIGSVYAREYGVPAVIGTTGIMDVIRDGDVLRVDGSAGTVEIIGR